MSVGYYDTNVKWKRVGSLVLTPHMLQRAAASSSWWTQKRTTVLLFPRIKKKVELQRGPQQLELNYTTTKELQCFFKASSTLGKYKGFTKSHMRLSSGIVLEALHSVIQKADQETLERGPGNNAPSCITLGFISISQTLTVLKLNLTDYICKSEEELHKNLPETTPCSVS